MSDETEPGTEPGAAEVEPGVGRRRRGPRRAVRRGAEQEAVLGVSSDERPDGWGEARDGSGATDARGERPASGSGFGSNDERLRQDVPPHW
ncbi:hypothetical protein L1785_02575 [Antribacter sp. KLBMP9083]|uniref:Uncharacterized protein n=1 Tax=Antribacter soli TaxID=2910976 RepID=A0AA41QBQ8_9MICO|nr:hypothetical protein [Antribacter soli]MCF4119855.1 hypothetical protein [Antribacter soli]